MKDFKVRFVLSFVVITLWPSLRQIQYALLLQYYRLRSRLFSHFPNFTSDHRYGTYYSLRFPSHPVSPEHMAQGILQRQTLSTRPSSRLMLPASLKGKKLMRCHTEMMPWTAEFATSVAGRGGILRVMIPRGECAWFDAVAMRAYKECPAQDQEDRRRYLRRRCFDVLSAFRLAPRPPSAYSPELVQFI